MTTHNYEKFLISQLERVKEKSPFKNFDIKVPIRREPHDSRPAKISIGTYAMLKGSLHFYPKTLMFTCSCEPEHDLGTKLKIFSDISRDPIKVIDDAVHKSVDVINSYIYNNVKMFEAYQRALSDVKDQT